MFSIRGLSQPMENLQSEMVKLGVEMYNNANELERLNANYTFIKSLVIALNRPSSYQFPFDSLKMISIQRSPDDHFRVFSWHIQMNDGTYRYYGTIQMNTKNGMLQLFPLIDHTAEIQDINQASLTPEKWYGAQYYQIVPINDSQQPYYVLLGWKGNTSKTTKKVIEVLYFKDNKAFMGLSAFSDGSKRKTYEYTKQASMLLKYDEKDKRIVLDHLAPADKKLEGQFEYYGPDMSYDAWQMAHGRWSLVEDIKVNNSQ